LENKLLIVNKYWDNTPITSDTQEKALFLLIKNMRVMEGQ
jgi:hypothetical protein